MKPMTMIVGAVLSASLILCVGCAGVARNTGYATPVGGFLFTGTTSPAAMTPPVNLPKYEILSKVSGSCSQTGILGLVCFGDGGLLKAKAEALKNRRDADDIINITVDVDTYSVLCLFTTVVTNINGDAIRYIPEPVRK